MPLFGKIVVIRRDGADGAQFPLTATTCVFGRNADCDIRVQLPNVAREHCRIEIDLDGKIFLVNLCPMYPTLLNKKAVTERVQVQHMDVFTVTDRSFRVEFPPGSPFRKGSPSTNGDISPIQPKESVNSEDVQALQTMDPDALPVEDEKSLLSISINNEQSVSEAETSYSKMAIKYSPKVNKSYAKASTSSYSLCTPLHKGKTVSPALRSSGKSKAKSPAVKSRTRTPLVDQTLPISRARSTSVMTPKSKTAVSRVSCRSVIKSSSALLADEIAELKLALTQQKNQSQARNSIVKTPARSSKLLSFPVKAKTPVTGDKIKAMSVTTKVRSNFAQPQQIKTPVAASIVKTPVGTPAAKALVATPRSKGLATKTSSVHRVKKVMTPSPRAKTPAQKRRSSSVPISGPKIAKKSPLRNISTQTDSLAASQDQRDTVDSILETLCGEKISNEIVSSVNQKSQSPNFSHARTMSHQKSQSPKIGFPAKRSARRNSLSPVTRCHGSYLTRSKSQSPLRSLAKSSPQKILQSHKILTKKWHSSNTSYAGVNEFARQSPSHQVLLQPSNLIASHNCTEAVNCILDTTFGDKTFSEEDVCSDEKLKCLKLSAAKAHIHRKSQSSKVSSPIEHSVRQMSQSPNIVEAHTGRKIPSPRTRSPVSSSTRSKSQSPFKATAVSSTDRMLHIVETPASQQQSSGRPNVGANTSPLHKISLQVGSPKVPQTEAEAVDYIVLTSFADMTSNEISSPTDEALQRSEFSPAETHIRRMSQRLLTRSTSSIVTRCKSQSPLRKPAETAEKKLQSSRMSPVQDLTYGKLHGAHKSPNQPSGRKPQSSKLSSPRSKSQSPLQSPATTSAGRNLRHLTGAVLDTLTHSKLQSPIRSASRRSESLETFSPSKTKDDISAITDECSDLYEQPFSPLILEMDDVDENKDDSKKSTPASSPRSTGGNDPGLLKSPVFRLRKSQPILKESENENASAKSAGNEIDTSLTEFDQTFKDRSFLSPSQGIKRPGSPLTGRHPKRYVSFGPDMSPELFDQSLPVTTPLKRGATPRRASISVDQMHVGPKVLLKTRQSRFSTFASILQEKPVKVTSGKSSKYLNTVEKLSEGGRQNAMLESLTTMNAEVLAASNLEPSKPVITSFKRETKPRRASFSQADIHLNSLKKNRRATSAAAWVIPEVPLEENVEKSPKGSKSHKKESMVVVCLASNVDSEVGAATFVPTPESSVVSQVTAGSQTGLQKGKIFTSRTGASRLLKTQAAAEATTLNENLPTAKTPAKQVKTPKRRQSLPSRRSSHPLTNMQNSSLLLQEYDPFAFESSPESSPTMLTPNPLDAGKNAAVNTAVSEKLIKTPVSKSAKKKLLSKPDEDVNTPKFLLDFPAPGSATSVVMSSKSVGKRSVKDVGLEQEHELPAKRMLGMPEGLKVDGGCSSKPKPVPEGIDETAAMATPNNPRSVERRSARFFNKELISEVTPSLGKSSHGRSMSLFGVPSGKADGQAISEQVFPVEEKVSSSRESATKTPSTDQRGRVKPEENLETPDREVTGNSVAGSSVLSTSNGIPTQTRFSESKSSPFKRPFGSEPRKLRSGQIGQLFRLSPEEARKAASTKNATGQMISERNVDLSSLSPLKFYKSPAAEAFTGKRSKVTPGRAVALRAVYGKAAIPALAELCLSRESSAKAEGSGNTELTDGGAKSLPVEKSSVRKDIKRKKSVIRVTAKKSLAKKTGFASKKNQAKALVLKKTKVGRKSVGQVAKRLRPAGLRNLRVKPNKTLDGQNSLPNIAENDVLQFLPEINQTLAELSKSPSSYSIPETPNGPGEMSVSPWSSPVQVSSGKRRSSAKKAGADTSESQRTSSFGGLTRHLASPTEVNSPKFSELKSRVKTPKAEVSPLLNGVKQLVKTLKVPKSRLSGVRKLVKTPKVQKSPQLSGVRNLVRTPKVQKSPRLSGVRKLVKTPKVQKSPQLSGIRNLIKTPKVQKSPQLSGIRNLVKTPKMQKSPKLSGVRELVKTPKVQKSPQLSGIKNLIKTPKVLKSPQLSGVRNLVKTPKMQKSPKLSGVRTLVKTPKVQKSPQLIGLKNLVRIPKVQESPDLTGINVLVKTPTQLRTSPLGGVKDLGLSSADSTGLRGLVEGPTAQNSPQLSGICNRKPAKKPRVKSHVKSPEVIKSVELGEKPSSSEMSAVKESTPKAQSTKKPWKSSATPIFTEVKTIQESAPVEDVTPVRRRGRPRKLSSRHVEKDEDIQRPSLKNVDFDLNFAKEDETVTGKIHKRKNVESDEKPAAKKQRLAIETEEQPAGENKKIGSKATNKQRGSKLTAKTLTRLSDVEVTVSVPKVRGYLQRSGASSTLKMEQLQLESAAPSPKLAGVVNSRAPGVQTTQFEQATIKENVDASVPETVKIGGRRQGRSLKTDLSKEAACQSGSKAKNKTRVKGKRKSMQAEVAASSEQVTVTGNAEISVSPETTKSYSRSKKDATEEVGLQVETIVNKAKRKTRARGRGIATEEELASEKMPVGQNGECSVAVKADDRQQGRAKNDVSEAATVQSKVIAKTPERKGRARVLGKMMHVHFELTDQVAPEKNVEASVQETVKFGRRQQNKMSKKVVNEEAAIWPSESVLNKAGKKAGGRGKARVQLAETVEENLLKAVRPKARNEKQAAKEVAVQSSDDAEETVEVKRSVRIGIKSEGSKAKGKGNTAASEEAALAVDNMNTALQLNKSENVATSSGKRGRKGTVVPTVSSDVRVVTETIRSSRKRKARTVDEIVLAETKKARLTAEAVASTQDSLLKPSRRGSQKGTTGSARNKDDGKSASKNLTASENEPAVKHAGSRIKRKTEVCKSSTNVEEVSGLETKQDKSSTNKVKSPGSIEEPRSKNIVTAQGRKTIEQPSGDVAFEDELPSKSRARKVRFDIHLPDVNALEKAPQSPAGGRNIASKRGSETKLESKELRKKKPKACISQLRSPGKDAASVSAKRTMRASRK